jgi:tetrahydromethanopterin S-methyltransferase subunit G
MFSIMLLEQVGDNKVDHSLLDTNDINKMIKKILNKMAVKVSFYNSRYFDITVGNYLHFSSIGLIHL